MGNFSRETETVKERKKEMLGISSCSKEMQIAFGLTCRFDIAKERISELVYVRRNYPTERRKPPGIQELGDDQTL